MPNVVREVNSQVIAQVQHTGASAIGRTFLSNEADVPRWLVASKSEDFAVSSTTIPKQYPMHITRAD